ncbi:hypothetical protein AFIC_002615 [[Pseudomonas] carboxydohydrogena]|uniref:Glycosyltransferase n=1 Tax=Afipia carboxydohydrogena TaxID=290 RepID=A0ABY8BQ05_AFICR|nr:hypothetical protein [[Pseudomonas] carboxydohydrogena]WEF51051.1 hypothetical protein AFIC_002615 [[Pseudomonas] carboxydohydrogena]
MEASIGEFRKKIEKEISGHELNLALSEISAFVSDVISHQTSVGSVLSSPDLDALCSEIGRLAIREIPFKEFSGRSGSSGAVYLVTELSKTGGLTRLLLDMIECGEAGNHTILISNLNENTLVSDIEPLIQSQHVSICVCPPSDYLGRLRWLQTQLINCNPRRTYVLPHHFDAPLIAACQPEITGELFYIHNCNHALALGVHLENARHVDLHSKGFYYCRESEGIIRNELWPLPAKDFGHRPLDGFLKHGEILSCTSGGFEKFESSHYLEQIPYAYRYEDVLPNILASTRGRHLHIGPLSDSFLQKLYTQFRRSQIDRERFIHVPFVASLSRALLEREVDLYIGSFPLGGGKATVEAMAAGIPVAVHSNYRSNLLSVESEVHPKACVWRKPEELYEFLRVQDKATLQDLSKHSRAYYAANHTIERLRTAMRTPAEGLPPRPLFRPDVLQSYLDDRQAFWEGGQKVIVSDQASKQFQQERQFLFADIDRLKRESQEHLDQYQDALRSSKIEEERWLGERQQFLDRLRELDSQCAALEAQVDFQRAAARRALRRIRAIIVDARNCRSGVFLRKFRSAWASINRR